MRAQAAIRGGFCRAVVAIALVLFGAGGSANAQTLYEALALAYLSNPTLLAQRAQLRSTDEQVPQALSNWRPTVTATGNLAEEYARTVMGGVTAKGDNLEAGVSLSVSQPLFRGFRTEAQTDQAENLVRAGRADLVTTEQQVLFDAVTAFMNVLRDQAVLELNINNEQVLRRELEATRDRFEVGEVTRTDVAQAESRLARAIADRVAAEGNLEISRADFVQVIGVPPGVLEQPLPYDDLPPDVVEVNNLAATHNPTVVSALYREAAARDTVDLVFGELLPSVSLDGVLSYADNPAPGTSEAESASIGATVTIPIYQAGSVTSRVRESKQVVSQRRMEIAEAKRAAVEVATQAWENFLTSRAQVLAFEEEADATALALEGVQEEAQAGLRTVLDVLDAEQENLDARVNLVGARRDEVVASYNLLSAIGRLTAPQLGLDVPYYDSQIYYDEVRDKWWGLGDDLDSGVTD
ncbi:MAG: TolC family outer membrane protein [Alphaproteobacteria bacterium]|nr:TolC family outer membrane protein [Alphaproteobacteria bacterium]